MGRNQKICGDWGGARNGSESEIGETKFRVGGELLVIFFANLMRSVCVVTCCGVNAKVWPDKG